MTELSIFYEWKTDDKGASFVEFALHMYVAAKGCDHFLHISQTESESLHIVKVAC